MEGDAVSNQSYNEFEEASLCFVSLMIHKLHKNMFIVEQEKEYNKPIFVFLM